MCAQSISCVQLFVMLMGFSRQEYWSELPFSSSRGSSQPRDWTHSSCIGRQIFLPLSQQGSPNNIVPHVYKVVSHYLTWSSLELDEINRTSCYWYLIIVIEGIQTLPKPQEWRLKSRLSGPSRAPLLWTQTAALLQS